MDVDFTQLGTALLVGNVVLVGVAQAVLGMLTKFGLRSYALLGAGAAVTTALVLIVRYGWEIEPLRLVVLSLLAVLSAAGYWRYRNGAEVGVPIDDPQSTRV